MGSKLGHNTKTTCNLFLANLISTISCEWLNRHWVVTINWVQSVYKLLKRKFKKRWRNYDWRAYRPLYVPNATCPRMSVGIARGRGWGWAAVILEEMVNYQGLPVEVILSTVILFWGLSFSSNVLLISGKLKWKEYDTL